MAQILVYFFKWYLQRDQKSGGDDVEASGEELPVPGQGDGHESDVTAHDAEDLERVTVERFEKNDVKTG